MATGRPTGRPSKPVERQRDLGNPGHKSLPTAPNVGEGLTGSSNIPIAPVSLSAAGLELWDQVWTAGKQWLALEVDRLTIMLLCEAFDEYAEMRDLLRSGEVERIYTTSNGTYVTHPYVSQMKELRAQMTAWMSSLGFSPADRARLGLAEVRVRDELDELQKRRAERAVTG
jgi:P27 family predicted phage terminase small subunit